MSAEKCCWHCGQNLGAEHRGFCLTRFPIKEAKLGSSLRPRFTLTDSGGEKFDQLEWGTIVHITRSTVHVRDPRGHIHKRYCGFFTTQASFLVEVKHCQEWVR